MNAADLGIYMYGYCGRGLGLGANMLYWGGGVAHIRNDSYSQYGTKVGYAFAMMDSSTFSYPYGDLPEDTAMVAAGISVFNSDYPGYKTVISNPPSQAQELFSNIYNLYYNN